MLRNAIGSLVIVSIVFVSNPTPLFAQGAKDDIQGVRTGMTRTNVEQAFPGGCHFVDKHGELEICVGNEGDVYIQYASHLDPPQSKSISFGFCSSEGKDSVKKEVGQAMAYRI